MKSYFELINKGVGELIIANGCSEKSDFNEFFENEVREISFAEYEQLGKEYRENKSGGREMRNCSNCEYWIEKYQQCDHPNQRNDESGAYDAPSDKYCRLWELAEVEE